MDPVYLALGALLLAITVVDLTWTTLWVEGGAGPLTSRLMSWTWRALRRIAGRNSRILSLAGPLIFAVSLGTWIALLWGGWTLVFVGAEDALVDTLDRGPVSWIDHAYFTGYAIFTLGNGDFVPRGDVWQLATVLATASGMLFVTLIVTYVLSVLDAVTQKRSFAIGVSGLGTRSTEIVRGGWTDEEFRGLDLLLDTYASQLNSLTSNHKAYPILHYFHTTRADHAPVGRIAALDEALTLLRFGVAEPDRPNDVLIENARSSVRNYLDILDSAFIEAADRSPPSPELDHLRDAGVPTVSDEEFAAAIEELDERRRTLLGLVESDAREWPS